MMANERVVSGPRVCAWCGEGLRGRPAQAPSHTICARCLARETRRPASEKKDDEASEEPRFPGRARKPRRR
jgi:hypothetical protein